MIRQEGTLTEDGDIGILVAFSYGTKVKQLTNKEWHDKVKRSHLIQNGTIIRKGVLR